MDTIQQFLDKLYSLHRRGIVPGLERMHHMLERLGNPHHALEAIHIAGTNGKGTVSSVLAAILQEAGEKVGLYTSPHIRSFNERIRVNGEPISDDELIGLYQQVEKIAEEVGATFFEVTTVMAFLKFQHSTSISVLECGLGGRLDATNVIHPAIAIITSIDDDHREWLGDTLEAIAAEKAGIIKAGIPAVIGEPRPSLREVFERHAASVGAKSVVFLDDVYWDYQLCDHTLEGMIVDITVGRWHFDNLFIPLHGEHQIRNVALAMLALQVLWNDGRFFDEKLVVRKGLEKLLTNSGLRARIEVVRTNPLTVVDVAHNPAGCAALVEVLKKPPFGGKWHIVFGVMGDKDYPQMLASLSALCKRFYFAAPKTERACRTDTLCEIAEHLGVESYAFPTVAVALETALAQGEPTLCVGSFFTIEEALEALEKLK